MPGAFLLCCIAVTVSLHGVYSATWCNGVPQFPTTIRPSCLDSDQNNFYIFTAYHLNVFWYQSVCWYCLLNCFAFPLTIVIHLNQPCWIHPICELIAVIHPFHIHCVLSFIANTTVESFRTWRLTDLFELLLCKHIKKDSGSGEKRHFNMTTKSVQCQVR